MKLSSIEAVFSDKGNEAGLAQRNLPYAGVVPLDEGERLSAACPHRDQQATPGRELLDERPRDLGTSRRDQDGDRKSTRLNSSHGSISYAVFCLKKKKQRNA